MDILQSSIAVIAIIAAAALALGALGMIFRAGVTAYVWTGMAFTILAVAVQLVPGLQAGDRAMARLAQADQTSDSRAVDRMREKVRRDIVSRTGMFLAYPHETVRVTNHIRRG